jgi:hypothetical protein
MGVKQHKKMEMKQNEKVDLIMAYECDEISEENALKLFSALIKSGECWTLQGHYGRTANALIENEIINSKGEILV